MINSYPGCCVFSTFALLVLLKNSHSKCVKGLQINDKRCMNAGSCCSGLNRRLEGLM